MSVVLLVRHAQANFGLGAYDRLSDHGRLQARHLGEVLRRREIRVDRIVSGDLERQRDTAEAVAAAFGLPAAIDPAWDEYPHAPIIESVKPAYRKGWKMVADLARTGNPNRRLQEIIDEGLEQWVAGAPDGQATAGLEPFSAYRGRIERALGAISSEPGTTVVVSSAGTIAAAVAPLLGVPDAAWPALHRVMVNTSLTKVVRGRRGLSLISFNEHGHLEGAPDVKITYR